MRLRKKKPVRKKRIEDEKNRLIWPFLVQFVNDIRSGARKLGSDDYAPGTCKAWKGFSGSIKASTHCTNSDGWTVTVRLCHVT